MQAKAARRARALERTRRDIVEAAARVFAEDGFHEASMAAIAREAGFTAPSLYTYFRSKDELYEALAADVVGGMLATFDAPPARGRPLREALRELLVRQASLFDARRDALRALMRIGPREGRKHPEQFIRAYATFLERAGGAAALRLPPEVAARFLFGILDAFFIHWLTAKGAPDAAGQVDLLLDLFLHGAVRGA
jgi:AcrR family transcriptional regulator